MSHIELENASVSFPVYSPSNRSLKNRVLSLSTGGIIDKRDDGLVVVRGLTSVSLKIRHGERVGLVGHNGAGKTTMLRLLSGIYRPTEGRSTIQGRCVSLINISLGIDPEATGWENIRLRAAMMGMSKSDLDRQIDEVAEFTGLGHFLNMPLRTYSTGMQLRLAFSISTAIGPEILIMDEWLSTGDEDFKKKADRRLRDIVESTHILILASHSRELLQNNCTRIVWLDRGQVRADGPTADVLPDYFCA